MIYRKWLSGFQDQKIPLIAGSPLRQVESCLREWKNAKLRWSIGRTRSLTVITILQKVDASREIGKNPFCKVTLLIIEIKTHFRKRLDYFPSQFYSQVAFAFTSIFLSHSPDFKDLEFTTLQNKSLSIPCNSPILQDDRKRLY